MASNPPARCCAIGVKHDGTAKGEVKTVDNIRTYFTYPEDKSTQNAIIILTDILGMDFINVQLIADQFAANGYFVAIPDLFDGDVVPINPPADFDFPTWIKEHLPQVPTVDPKVEKIIKHMRGELGVKKLGAVGYCFGGKYAIRWLKPGSADASYVAHPSFVSTEEVEAIAGPLSIAAAETDNIFPAPKRRETEDILEKKNVPYQLNLFSDVEHGFAVRCDLSKRPAKFAKEQAFLQAVAWFDEYIKQGSLDAKL